MAYTVLIVDDERDIRELIADVLEEAGYKTRLAASASEAITALTAGTLADAVVLDVWLQHSDQDGIAVLDYIVKRYPSLPVIMISGHASIETAIAAIRNGAFDFIEKPFQEEHLLHRLHHAFQTRKLKQDNVSLRQAGDEQDYTLIGDSPAMTRLRRDIERIAPAESRVIIHGPPGCGKTVAAYALHRASARASGPFVIQNTALMTEENADLYLCGGADSEGKRIPSIFEQAHGGTLFVDEIADIPVSAQRKMLKIVQQGYVESPEGGKIFFSARVIAGAKRNLTLEMRAGRLREDLYYRIGVEELRMPSLRERISDLEALTRCFMELCAKRHGIPPRKLTHNALAALAAYSWPGDVRELRNLIERLLINAPGHSSVPISSSMLPPDIIRGGDVPANDVGGKMMTGSSSAAARPSSSEDDPGNVMALPLREAREAFEKQYLSAQIRRFNNNISKTAEFIGMERSALYRKLKLLNLYEGMQRQREDESRDETAGECA